MKGIRTWRVGCRRVHVRVWPGFLVRISHSSQASGPLFPLGAPFVIHPPHTLFLSAHSSASEPGPSSPTHPLLLQSLSGVQSTVSVLVFKARHVHLMVTAQGRHSMVTESNPPPSRRQQERGPSGGPSCCFQLLHPSDYGLWPCHPSLVTLTETSPVASTHPSH